MTTEETQAFFRRHAHALSTGDRDTALTLVADLTDLGRPIAFRECVVHRLDGGRIVEVWSVFDHLALVRAEGAAR